MCRLKIAFQTAFPVCVKQWGKLRYGIFLLQMGKGGTSILPFMRKGIRTLRLRGSRTRCPLYDPFRFCRYPWRTRQTRGLHHGGSTDQIPCWDRQSVVCPHSDQRQIPILWCLCWYRGKPPFEWSPPWFCRANPYGNLLTELGTSLYQGFDGFRRLLAG